MKVSKIYLLGLIGALLISTASNCKKPKSVTETNPTLSVEFNAKFASSPMELRSTEYTKTDGEVVKLNNWSVLLSKVSLVKTDDSKVMLGDGYMWIDFYNSNTKYKFTELPSGNYKGISFQFGIDSIVNHADPNVWPATHPLNPNLTGMHWGWSGGYIFMILDGTYKTNAISGSWNPFSFHTVGDVFKRNYFLPFNFELAKNTNKTATIAMAFDELFKNPIALKIGNDPNNHCGNFTEINWMEELVDNAEDMYELKSVK